jgi:alpha-L-rhamnosidase
MVFEGSCEISNVHLREYANPDVFKAHFSCSDMKLSRLFEAGRETLRQNSVDIFMDCPSRERGGYLCDSFFTARAAFELSGNTKVERNFLENYLLVDKFDKLPDDMLPMCYPSDIIWNMMIPNSPYGQFIPNWSLWLVIQLEEYLKRSGNTELVEQFKPKVLRLFEYFKAFENEYGLLEKLEGWVFVEWSKANDYVQDVNYPSNMLYAGALAAAGRIYNMNELLEHSDRAKEEIRKQSYDGNFFVDNAVRENGELRVTKNKSEVCQYYAFFFDVVTAETHELLWNTLISEFGPKRKATGAHPEVDSANAFIGNYLRLELLSRYGLGKQLVDESSEYLMYMVNQTGTIWEHADDSASCNHGFGSHIIHWLYKNVLGISNIDLLNKTISLRFEASNSQWCEGKVPISNGYLSVKWWREDNTVFYNVELPGGFKLEVENMTGLHLVRK